MPQSDIKPPRKGGEGEEERKRQGWHYYNNTRNGSCADPFVRGLRNDIFL